MCPPCRRAWNSFRILPALLVPRSVPSAAEAFVPDRRRKDGSAHGDGACCRRANFSEAAPQWGLVPPAAAPLDVAVAVRHRSKGSHFDHTPPVVKLVRGGRVVHRLTPHAPRREPIVQLTCPQALGRVSDGCGRPAHTTLLTEALCGSRVPCPLVQLMPLPYAAESTSHRVSTIVRPTWQPLMASSGIGCERETPVTDGPLDVAGWTAFMTARHGI
jgi:hypothetical protein